MYKKFASQPHQPFFTAGIINFIIFLTIFALDYSGIITPNSSLSYVHTYPMIHIIFIQFFMGFLFVVFPRFLTQAEVKPNVYMNIFFLFLLGSIIYIISLFTSKFITHIAMIILTIGDISAFIALFKIYKKSIVTNKIDTKYILIALFIGILSNIGFLISSFDFSFSNKLEVFSINLGFFLFLFALVFTISQRMIPFFTSIKIKSYVINKSKYILPISFILLGLKTISLSASNDYFSLIINLLLFIVFTYELIKWKLPAFSTTAIVWVLYLALMWIPIGFFIFTLQSLLGVLNVDFIFEYSALHAISIGYFVTVLLGFGTRVVLGHSRRIPSADKVTISLFWAVQGIVLLRIFAGISANFGKDYIFWITTSAILLIIGLLIWSYKYLAILIRG